MEYQQIHSYHTMFSAKIVLSKTEEGGRVQPLYPPTFMCIIDVEGELFSCKLFLPGEALIYPGDSASVKIQFVFDNFEKELIRVGCFFLLKQPNIFARGIVTGLIPDNINETEIKQTKNSGDL